MQIYDLLVDINLNSTKLHFDKSYNVITDIALSYLIYILKDDIKC